MTAKADDTVYVANDKDGQPALQIMFRSTYKLLWDDNGSGAKLDGSAFVIHPSRIPKGFKQLGHIMMRGRKVNPNNKIVTIIVRDVSPKRDALRSPVGLAAFWSDAGSGGSHDLEVFSMKAPTGYRSLGPVLRSDRGRGGWAVGGIPAGAVSSKTLSQFACVRKDLVDEGKVTDLIWSDAQSGANNDFSAWKFTYAKPTSKDGAFRLDTGLFVPNGNHSKPDNSRARVLRVFMPRDGGEFSKWINRAQSGR